MKRPTSKTKTHATDTSSVVPVPIKWTPRVKKAQLYRLYKSEAAGIIDEALLEEVGITLLLRCRDILNIAKAAAGEIQCPQCLEQRKVSIINRGRWKPEATIACPSCSWRTTWGEYHKTFQSKQLWIGGARKAFEEFVERWPAANSTRDKMLLVDRLIHEFHYNSVRDLRDLPTRAAAVNLIEGRLTDVVAFLNQLSGLPSDPELVADVATWREKTAKAQVLWKHPQ